MSINKTRLFSALAALAIASFAASGAAQAAPIHNIVLVHGAFVTGAGWKPVYDILVRDGYHVAVAQHPLTSFADDVTAVKRTLAMEDGPVILVGHSYGGAIITTAGNDPKVAGLVYIAAHALDEGETEAANGRKFPNATKAVKKTDDGFLYLDPAFYPADFAADLPKQEADFEARSQALTAATVFTTPATHPAWKDKPSWYMVAKADRIINPDLERMYAKRRQHDRRDRRRQPLRLSVASEGSGGDDRGRGALGVEVDEHRERGKTKGWPRGHPFFVAHARANQPMS